MICGTQMHYRNGARAAPDGYTLPASSGSPMAVGPHLYKLKFESSATSCPSCRSVAP